MNRLLADTALYIAFSVNTNTAILKYGNNHKSRIFKSHFQMINVH
jgi:hypothetical protein